MFAIAEVGSKQFKITKDQVLLVPKINKKKDFNISKILLTTDGKEVNVGTPYVKGAKAVCEILAEVKGPKTIAYKFKRRKSSAKTIGHRETLTKIKIKDIVIA